MDIVTRLRQFMEYRQIPISQFADTCNIPRPTLSQLLNGRNKKVSDELITKIHDAYPALSVLWLMFGEGDMMVGENIKTSEPQKDGSITFSDIETHATQATASPNLFSETLQENGAEKFTVETNDPAQGNSNSPINISGIKADNGSMPTDSSHAEKTATISFTPDANTVELDSRKKIVNIIVYYSDNSFEAFVPNIR